MTAPPPKWDSGLPPEQRDAAAHTGSHARLLAGPGTGKTWTLTKRVLFLIEDQKVEPKKVVVLTFTRAAAHELRSRIENELAGKIPDRPTVTTLHSYALRNLLHNSARVDSLPQPLRIADDWEERNIIEEDLKDLINVKVATIRERLAELSADWNTLGVEGDPKNRKADPAFVGAWQQHRGIFGYTLRAELVYQLKRALEQRPDMELVPTTQHLLVDEYQDLNACDLAVIDAIRKRGAQVYGAGDDDQSIYGFRHALPAGIRAFVEKFAPAGDLKLVVCHRCDKSIIELATFVAKLDPQRLDKPLQPRDDAGEGEVRLLRFDNEFEEANAVASISRYLIDEENYKPDDILILVRSDRNGAFSGPIADAHKNAGVPINLNVSADTPLDGDNGRVVLSLLRLCQFVGDSLAWRTLLQVRQNKLGAGAFKAVYKLAHARGLTFAQSLALVAGDDSLIARFGRRHQDEHAAVLAQLATICPLLSPPAEEGKALPPLSERLDAVLAVVLPSETDRAPIAEYLKRIAEESEGSSLAQLLQAISASESAPEQELLQGAVNVLTMHRAKGLSAKTVVVIAAEDEYIPGRQTGAAEDDERRLLYVSLTRARQRLIVTFANDRISQQRHTGRTSGKTTRTLTRYLRDAPIKPQDGNQYVQKLGGP